MRGISFRPYRTKDGYSFRTPGGRVRVTTAELEECHTMLRRHPSPFDERDHMRYIRDCAARWGHPLGYLRWRAREEGWA